METWSATVYSKPQLWIFASALDHLVGNAPLALEAWERMLGEG